MCDDEGVARSYFEEEQRSAGAGGPPKCTSLLRRQDAMGDVELSNSDHARLEPRVQAPD